MWHPSVVCLMRLRSGFAKSRAALRVKKAITGFFFDSEKRQRTTDESEVHFHPSAPGFSPVGLGLPDVHASTGPMDKWFLINQLLAFRARERHARQPPEQKIESTLTGRKLVRIPLWTFFLLRTRPPSPDDHPERVWVMPHHTRTPWTMRKLERRASRAGDVSAATKAARRWASSRSGSRQTPPAWPRSSRGDGRTAVLRTSGSCRGRRRGSLVLGHYLRQLKGSWAFHERQEGSYEDRRLQRQPKPPLCPAGTLGCKKRAKRTATTRGPDH